MSKIENITERILKEAKDEILILEEKQRESLQKIKVEFEKRAQRESEVILKQAQEEASRRRDRVLSSAKISARDMKLKAKQESLNDVFHQVKTQLSAMNDEEFTSFVNSKLKDITLTGEEKILIPEKREALKDRFSLPAEITQMEDGFRLVDGDISVNFTFSELVDAKREDMEGEVIRTLFGEA